MCLISFRVFVTELTSRYWSYLFGNLERSISEIYDSCEKQDNVLQCKVSCEQMQVHLGLMKGSAVNLIL